MEVTNLIIGLIVVNILVVIFKKSKLDINDKLNGMVDRIKSNILDEFQRNRDESKSDLKDNRTELSASLDRFENQFTKKTIHLTNKVENGLSLIQKDNNKQLDKLRETVDEKLQKTLNDRLALSFREVVKHLKSVESGIGEMKNLAHDVGGLKKVLSNVKTRGGVGEIQLEMLLENIMSPGQYTNNVITNPSSKKTVEFVVNLPGNNENGDKLLLPIDAKFPKDIYESLLNAYDTCDKDLIKKSKQELASTIIKMAKDIKEKYIYPPKTTDFAIMFLPFEGLFSEVVRDTELVTKIQKEYKVTITGPSTLSAILNSLQIGFRTLVLQKRGSEVWEILEGVKKEFSSFSGLLGKAQKNIQMGLGQLDNVLGVRTRAIEKNLIKVDKLENSQDDSTIVKLIK